jgi:uncharacterized repeat protein (TIGR01451 family)
MRSSFLMGGMIAAAAIAAPALAAEPVKITTTVLAEAREAAADGTVRIKLVPAGRVVPGDHVVYRVSVANGGSKPAAGVTIANPVPANMLYAGPATGSPAPEVSVDGVTFAPIGALRVAGPAGPRAATPSDVRAVRWKLAQPIAPGASNQVAFRALLK